MATKRKKKEKLSTKILNWGKDNREAIAGVATLLGMTVIPAAVGYIFGNYDGQKKGYRKGISDLAGQVPRIMAYSADAGAGAYHEALCEACDESGHEEYARALENLNLEKILDKAADKFVNDEGVKSITDQLIKGRDGTW